MQLPNIPDTPQKRVVIIGGGFAGLKLARTISKKDFQVVLIDKNNYHQFQPLFYQVATAGLEPSSISFPLRKIFQKQAHVHIRIAELQKVNTSARTIITNTGELQYDFLVIATGADTNYFGNTNIASKALPMKSTSEALGLRNRILQNFEDALSAVFPDEMESLMNIVLAGGGATGVELAGALAEMKRHVLPKDYPELDFDRMKIYLLEGSPRLLNAMSDEASAKAHSYLEKMGVIVKTSTIVKDYDGKRIVLTDGTIRSSTLIWAAGVKGNFIEGIQAEAWSPANRFKVNRFNQVEGYTNIFALGDIALMTEDRYPKGHPQMAQPAIQQAGLLAKNILRMTKGEKMQEYSYRNLGSMATVGRNLAVADLPGFKFQGFFAWVFWLLVHLMSIVGVKNRIFIFLNWCWNYITYDQSLRLIIKPKIK
ncbi:MAG: NAD(P)/FAD-dependent oxidoreductase [Bacteroidetes bacterium]|nr:NAD(P)/FAD-dependent oxidoreductase [Bacteroidota bacterium]